MQYGTQINGYSTRAWDILCMQCKLPEIWVNICFRPVMIYNLKKKITAAKEE